MQENILTQRSTDITRVGLSPDEAAAAAGVTRTRIYGALRAGDLAAHKAGKQTIIEPSELQRWVQSLPAWKAA
jgi:excisionase family DNA binding protein